MGTRKEGQMLAFSAEEFGQMENLLEQAYAKTPTTAVAREICALHKMNLRGCVHSATEIYARRLARTEELLAKHHLRLCDNEQENAATLQE